MGPKTSNGAKPGYRSKPNLVGALMMLAFIWVERNVNSLLESPVARLTRRIRVKMIIFRDDSSFRRNLGD
jgi:hypothetical protein